MTTEELLKAYEDGLCTDSELEYQFTKLHWLETEKLEPKLKSKIDQIHWDLRQPNVFNFQACVPTPNYDYSEYKKRINKMMDYLKIKKVRAGHINDLMYDREDETLYVNSDDEGDKKATSEFGLGNIEKRLVKHCRRMAMEKWSDIELANAGLYWCTYE